MNGQSVGQQPVSVHRLTRQEGGIVNDNCSNEHNRTKVFLLPDDVDHQLTYFLFFKFLLRTTQTTDKAAENLLFECYYE